MFSKKAAEAAPESPLILNNYGYAAERIGRLTEAWQIYNKAAMFPPPHPQVLTNLRNLKEKLQRTGLSSGQ